MTSKLYVHKVLNRLSLSQLRQLAGEFKMDSRGSKSQLISRLINPVQIGGTDPTDPVGLIGPTDSTDLEDYWIIGGQLEALLLNHIDSYTGELNTPIEQIKKVLDEEGIRYDYYSPKEWFKILLPSKILSKNEPPFDVLPVFVNSLNVLPELSYGELKLLNSYYPKTLNIDQQTLEAKKQADLRDITKTPYLEGYNVNRLFNQRNIDFSDWRSLKTLPDSFGALSNLEQLDLSGTKLKSLPDSIGALFNLKKLTLYETPLESLPDSFGSLRSLETLSLGETLLKTLPESFGSLSNLKTLDLGYAEKLESLPKSFGDLSNLEILDLNGTQLKSLPESIGDLKNLIHLDLSDNPSLTTLPNSLGDLTKLEYLDLSNNSALESLPESIGKLSNLKSLYLGGSAVKSLPKSLGDLSKLERLSLEEDSLKSLPLETINALKAQGTFIESSSPTSELASPASDDLPIISLLSVN